MRFSPASIATPGSGLLTELGALIEAERQWMVELDALLLSDSIHVPAPVGKQLLRARRALHACTGELSAYVAMRAKRLGSAPASGTTRADGGLRSLRLGLFTLRRQARRLLRRAIEMRHLQASGALRGLVHAQEETWDALATLSGRLGGVRTVRPYAA